jgi:alanyl-tRNA synthetase
MMTSSEIRTQFLRFFESKGHQVVPSAPIVVKNDPTLMFTNAGMNQFKDYFLGNAVAPSPRIADTQKCLRVSGKHNDLEEVGVDTYHHTMFEMLGNWSFGGGDAGGGYFKSEAIAWSWELLTSVLRIPVDRLYVSIFEGDEAEGLPRDEEAAAEWKKWIAADRIILGNKKDNFWEMGDTGPCGPCTEIHVDMRPDHERSAIEGRTLVNADHPQVIEIWNNVFIQYNRLKGGALELLPARHVDTGMGFERLVRVIQGKRSNYDTDVFSPIITATEEITGLKYSASDDGKADIAFRVVADHIRAIAFAIADGQLPSNTGAGYVIRRILRRAVRYYYSYLSFQQPLLHRLLPGLATQFDGVFPELKSQEAFVARVIREEEEAFLRTLGKGLLIVEEYTNKKTHAAGADKTIDGSFAFKLNDTYGFPIDLTELIAKEKGWTVDAAGFTAEMQQQKQRSRAATTSDTEDWTIITDGGSASRFTGYEALQSDAQPLKFRKVTTGAKETYQLVLDQTPFYAESGGQVGDTGTLSGGDTALSVLDTKRENDSIIHIVDRLPAALTGPLRATVDSKRRRQIATHHTATHLMHAALRKVLGTHVAQKGSLVTADSLRFDFSHFTKVTDEEIAQVEQLVNAKIRENILVDTRLMGREEAMQSGAMALFGEKYGDTVRVVIIDPQFSVELCGGTHVKATGEIGLFRLISESAVAAGVRRVEAVCGSAAESHTWVQLQELQQVRQALKGAREPVKAIHALVAENSGLRKELEKRDELQLKALKETLSGKTQLVNGMQFIGEEVAASSGDALKKLASELRADITVLVAAVGGKAHVAIALSDRFATEKGTSAVQIIKQHVAPLIKGGGGGQKNLAAAGGQDISALHSVIQTVKGLL